MTLLPALQTQQTDSSDCRFTIGTSGVTDEDLLQSATTETAAEILVRGRVQGVGFRPTVYRFAQELNLRGCVLNDGQGVTIRVAGDAAAMDYFVQQLATSPPPLARIETLERKRILPAEIREIDFQIKESVSSRVQTEISTDAATCPECRAEVFDPYSRRYRYPFTNCTHCGPRLSIVKGIPYDRALTSMAGFDLCPDCQQEYGDVTDRRFHAQPIACHVCGPHAWLERSDGRPIHASMFSMLDDVDAVCTLLQRGEIVAIKGIGGFHLACDATNTAAVDKLRQRKRRYHKPFALMARDLGVIEQYCQVGELERQALESAAAPIVLLRQKADERQEAEGRGQKGGESKRKIAAGVAPDQNRLGFMLPYTPLHHLILKRMNRPIVLTSGNLADEPQSIDNEQARQKLGGIADYFLFHNREIVNRVDDSVVRVVDGTLQILRRARGYAPAPIRLPVGFEVAPPLLAMGSELKTTFCLVRDGQAILSQHLGDLEDATVLEAYQQTLNLYQQLFEHRPETIALDLHPEYLASKLGQDLARQQGLKLEPIQHHHAHIAACLAENGLPLNTAPILGIALDGLGYGEQDKLWGGEFLLADYCNFQRLAHFKPVALLGGEQAIYQPWRNTYAHLMATGNWQDFQHDFAGLELWQFLEQQPLSLLEQMLSKGINSPPASSCGRLFDAVAAAVGLCRESCSYEGQGAIALEALAENYLNSAKARTDARQRAYPLAISVEAELPVLNPGPLWRHLLTDLQQGTAPGAIAARFHLGLAGAIVAMVEHLHQQQQFTQVALSGGVWQNCLLLQEVRSQLTVRGLAVLTHQQVPANDGGLSLGQATVAAARTLSTNPQTFSTTQG